MKRFQVVGIGNAMVDVIAHADEDFLAANGIGKGIMQLIDMDRAVDLYARIGPAREVSGGSAANTIAGAAQLGGRTAYVGKVKDDQLGAIFAHDLRAQGAVYETPLAAAGPGQETGRCIILVTPDGERSMNTYLGISAEISPEDVAEEVAGQTDWLFLRAISSTRTRARPPSRRRRATVTGAAARLASRCRTRSAWTATATTSAGW
jgi:sugar/nucleoside kinase (ribokinase family)